MRSFLAFQLNMELDNVGNVLLSQAHIESRPLAPKLENGKPDAAFKSKCEFALKCLDAAKAEIAELLGDLDETEPGQPAFVGGNSGVTIAETAKSSLKIKK